MCCDINSNSFGIVGTFEKNKNSIIGGPFFEHNDCSTT